MNQYISIGEFQDHLKNYYNLFNMNLIEYSLWNKLIKIIKKYARN